MVRRVIFAVSVVVFPYQIFLQIAAHFTSGTTMMIYLGECWPFESTFATKMEIYNEVTNIILVYHMMTFTDWLDNPETRYNIGYSVLFLVCLNISIHFSYLMHDTFLRLKFSCKKKAHLRKLKKIAKSKKLRTT